MDRSTDENVQVFPGGNFDKTQDDSLGITAIRETFEESGLLLANSYSEPPTLLSDSSLDEARSNIHTRKQDFKTFLADHHLNADINILLPFTQWITPVNALRFVHSYT